MRRDLPSRHRGSCCNHHAPPSFTLTTSSPSLPLRRRRLPFAVGSRPAKGRPPLRLALPPLLGAGLSAGGSPLRAGRSRSCPRVADHYGLLPLRATAHCRGPSRSRPPLASSQAMAGRPCRGPGRGQPPLHADSMHVAAPPPQAAPTFTANRCNKCVEQFYVIQSLHMQFKTNFSYENLGSDTIVRKP
ncbi:hypothetical protein GW17_00055549 [Ensete ventricosum]|nr:hypothetical protein GW17_00055549 [Ensete ventricosum]